VALGLFLVATAAGVAGVMAVARGEAVPGALLCALAVLVGPVGVNVLV
jgi:hypothetical protein